MSDQSRRDFIATTAAAATAATAATAALGAASFIAPSNFGAWQSTKAPAPSKTINIGVIGAGGRGSGAANDTLSINPNVRIVAIADIDVAKATAARDALAEEYNKDGATRVAVPNERIFGGLDGYQKVLDLKDVDLVILATAPGFRHVHITAAVAAKKHVFAEKPVCVDVAGYRACCAAHDKALAQGTCIVTGTQYRRQPSFIEGIKKIREGMIGDVVAMTARYCSNGIWYRDRKPGMSDMEYQIYNWMHFIWLSGDQITEQAVHNIDVVHWVMGGPPVRAFASGSRWNRPADSEMWDSISCDYEFADGRICSFTGRHWANSDNQGDNVVYGSKGIAYLRAFDSGTQITDRNGKELFSIKGNIGAAYKQEHKELVEAVVASRPIVELRQTAESSLMAVMGREAAYSGQTATWDFMTNKSQLDLMPKLVTIPGDAPAPFVRKPGEYRLQ
jgi:predicted dehydrogenase